MTTTVAGFPADEWGVTVVVGTTPRSLEGVTRDEGFMQMAPGEFLALIDDVGRMHVTTDTVTLEPAPGRTVHDMDYLVYGWAPRWIRVLRQEYTLHASAVVIGAGAMAIMGFSGAGKSTTVTALERRGHGLIIDDIVPVDFVDKQPMVFGWERPVHLTDEAAAHFAVPDEGRVGPSALSKISASVPWVDGARPLRVAVELMIDESTDDVTCRALVGAERIQAILNHSNSAGISAADGRAHSFFAWATRLASSVEVHRITRPPEGWHLDIVLDHIASIIVDQGSTTPP